MLGRLPRGGLLTDGPRGAAKARRGSPAAPTWSAQALALVLPAGPERVANARPAARLASGPPETAAQSKTASNHDISAWPF